MKARIFNSACTYFYLRIFCVSCSQICLESFDLNSLDSTDEPPMKKMKAEAIEEDTSIYTNPIEKDNEEVCVHVYTIIFIFRTLVNSLFYANT